MLGLAAASALIYVNRLTIRSAAVGRHVWAAHCRQQALQGQCVRREPRFGSMMSNDPIAGPDGVPPHAR